MVLEDFEDHSFSGTGRSHHLENGKKEQGNGEETILEDDVQNGKKAQKGNNKVVPFNGSTQNYPEYPDETEDKEGGEKQF